MPKPNQQIPLLNQACRLLLLIIASSFLFTGLNAGENQSAVPSKKVEPTVQEWIDRGCYPWAGLLVTSKDGKVLIEKYWGAYNRDCLANLASATKWLEVAAMMTAVDDGKIDLEAPIERYLTELKGTNSGKVLFRQLLSHTSGFNNLKYPDSCRNSTLEIIRYLGQHPEIPAQAGSEFYYGGTGLGIAAEILKRTTGKDIDTIFHERVTYPLGMTYTEIAAKLYREDLSRGLVIAPYSIAHDYIIFLQMLANGGVYKGRRILSANSVEAMLADQVRDAKVPEESLEEAGCTKCYGLGCWRNEVDADGKAIRLSCPGWSGFYPWIDRKRGICGVFTANITDKFAFKWDVFHPMKKSASLVPMINEYLDTKISKEKQ